MKDENHARCFVCTRPATRRNGVDLCDSLDCQVIWKQQVVEEIISKRRRVRLEREATR